MRSPRWRRGWLTALVVLALLAAACGDGDRSSDPPGTVSDGPTDTTIQTTAERCAANSEAGTITFLTGFLFFPALSIAAVMAAEDQGFFDDLCLEVEIVPSVPGEAIVLISENVIQFTADQIGELAQARAQGARATMVLNWGHTPVHVLVVEDDSPIRTPADFRDATIGSVGGTLNAGLQGLLLNGAGLRQGEDYTVVNRSFNPFEIEAFDAIAAFRSNEPDTLEKGGIPVRIFRPEDFGSVGTFAGIQVSDEFARLHPGAVEDWVRAVVAATEWAVDHPDETVRIAERMCGDSCGEFSIEHELFRFTEELNLSLASTPDGHVFGAIHEPTVRAELEAMAGFGIIETVPDPRVLFDNRYVDAVHDGNGDLIWECVAPTCRAPR